MDTDEHGCSRLGLNLNPNFYLCPNLNFDLNLCL
jgi:hypothetical protein